MIKQRTQLVRYRVASPGGTPEHVMITSDLPMDDATEAVVAHYAAKLGKKMDEIVGDTAVPLDGRFSAIRTSETNVGNLVADTMADARQVRSAKCFWSGAIQRTENSPWSQKLPRCGRAVSLSAVV